MKIRTVDDLDNRIRQDLTWRRHEMQLFDQMIGTAGPIAQRSLLRAAVALLYAHWEGFIKSACHYYLCYLAFLKLDTSELTPALAAMSLRKEIRQSLDSQSAKLHVEMVEVFRNSIGRRARLPTTREAIATKSNLSYPVLENILISIGLDPSSYEQSRDLINTQLVDSRNRIAHGENDYIRQSEWRELENETLNIMESIANLLVNSAVQKKYLVTPVAN
ncbi:MAE_28990/MAE_18760 family HEPN-like nuclease [Mycobacterium avium]|nr:MAE_28990/MAE_18760 family HEPN-like nuclease [Mycobacterium avium]QBB84582.1 hypothetical protein BJP74_23595 [Mycobacterium avium subsp. hominissuis]QBB84752.1 hypothetical protein BEP52_23995 [Mycobacterium avium subsp. hominissuis]QBC16825.1 hypothetical protein BJP78_23755 [Mycobacterium avium subsp. hominissuis]BAN29758.1 hypothetical protein MAH_0684 [Mycobacterium avium subsp. hominissuis TH135]